MNNREEVIRKVDELHDLLYGHLGCPQKVIDWTFTSNPHFGGCEPASLLLAGKLDKVLATVKYLIEENKE